MRALLPLVLLVGCSEYDLDHMVGAGEGVPEASNPGGTPPITGDECPADAVEGFQASVNEDCVNEIQTGTFDPVVSWSAASFADGGNRDVMMTPIVTTLNDDNGNGVVDDDDVPDIVFVAFGSGATVRAISGNDGHELWAWSDFSLQITGGVAAGDLDGDGVVEIVAMLNDGVVVLSADGKPIGRTQGLAGAISGTSDVPSISDMDHDGSPEIIVGNAILSSTGQILGRGSYGRGGVTFNVGTCSFAVDVDGDGVEEVVTGNALYRMDGSAIWHNNLQDGYPAVGDFDLDGTPEIVVSGDATLRLLDASGNQKWSVAIPGASASYYGGPPTVADFDGDGVPEIGVAAGSRYSVVEGDGTVRWQAVTDDSSSGNTGSSVFDFEGDGAAEVVYADQTSLWVFSGVDGSVKLQSHEHSNGTWLEYPVIADVDADGHADIVVPQEEQNGGFTGITVFRDRNDSWQPGRRTWNQHAYFITNVDDDGGIPTVAQDNWLSFNSFRSGDLTSGNGTNAPDLVVAKGGICEVECPGVVKVYVNPGNEGLADVLPGAQPTVTLWAETVTGDMQVGTVALANALTAGMYQDSVTFDVGGLDWSGVTGLRAEIASQEPECDTTNNTVTFEGPFCQ